MAMEDKIEVLTLHVIGIFRLSTCRLITVIYSPHIIYACLHDEDWISQWPHSILVNVHP